MELLKILLENAAAIAILVFAVLLFLATCFV